MDTRVAVKSTNVALCRRLAVVIASVGLVWPVVRATTPRGARGWKLFSAGGQPAVAAHSAGGDRAAGGLAYAGVASGFRPARQSAPIRRHQLRLAKRYGRYPTAACRQASSD